MHKTSHAAKEYRDCHEAEGIKDLGVVSEIIGKIVVLSLKREKLREGWPMNGRPFHFVGTLTLSRISFRISDFFLP